MNRQTRKFFAVLMLLWLPVFTGSALASSVPMSLPQGDCCPDAVVMSHQGMDHEGMDMGEHQMHHDEMPASGGDHGDCGVCQLACSGYMGMPGAATPPIQAAARETTHFLVAFNSVTFTPLLPPPLVRA